MFTDLANSIIKKHSRQLSEGAITTQDTAESITNEIKNIINGLSEKIAKFNQHAPLYPGQIEIIVNDINKQIEEKLKNKPVPIKFEKLNQSNLGNYDTAEKYINLNAYKYLVDQIKDAEQGVPADEQGLYKLKDVNNIDFEALDEVIGHELIHQQQDERSGGKYFDGPDKSWSKLIKKYDANKNNLLDDDEIKKVTPKDFQIWQNQKGKEIQQKYGEILAKKNEIAPNMPDDRFLERVTYLNRKAELNTWAKDTVQKFIKQTYDYFYNLAKQNNTAYNISADQMRNAVLAPFLNAADTNVFKNQPQQESVQNYPGQQPTQNTQPQQPQQPVQQQQQPQQQNNQELRNRLQQNRNTRDQQKQQQQQQGFTLTQDMKAYQTKRLLSLFPEYALLTSPNKQKWWNYAYQILNKMKFKPFNTNGQTP